MNKGISRIIQRGLLLRVAIGAAILIVLALTIFSHGSRQIALLTAKQTGLLRTKQIAPLQAEAEEQRLKAKAAEEEAQPPELALTLTLLTPDEVPALAPVVARVSLHNTTADPITFVEDYTVNPFVLEILDERGVLVASTNPLMQTLLQERARHAEWCSGISTIAAGKSRDEIWVISVLYPFDKPGKYELRMTCYKREEPWKINAQDGEEPPLIAQDAVPLTVRPFDREALEKSCEDIFAPTDPGDFKGVLSNTRMAALYSVRHDVVLPYLDWMARAWNSSDACQAMRRIGSERAEELLAQLASRKNALGQAARQAMESPIKEISMRDIIAR